MKILNALTIILITPIVMLYLLFCFSIPLIRTGKIRKGKGIKIWIVKDLIHADYIFKSTDLSDVFQNKKKYLKVGWGDRKIFLETKEWKDLKIKDFLFAFFGLNKTVLKTEFLDELPKEKKELEIDEQQLQSIKKHILKSFRGKPIPKRPKYNQKGEFYESELRYNCIKNCNNWLHSGLVKAGVSNRIWCPLSFWL